MTSKPWLTISLVIIAMGGLAMSAPASAINNIVGQYFEQAEKVGEGRMTYLFWDVYDARLYAPQGKWQEDGPYVLELHYLRSLDGEAIAERSVEEIRKQGFDDNAILSDWLEQMRNIFPDVNKGVTLVGIADQNQHTHFYRNDELIGSVPDPEFTRRFFGIWLSENTSEPSLRKKLLGVS
ncbi:chalcone isomerase family protein [Aestuariibacter salexigens]|uniref:chalcone isomerase family protein n=1 Tax=Aestuariibacter salexigens TaxID=226010 RepID=UPI000400FE50|nr:chalcone isomerase family protein [Aestuariibacter salexigens]